MNIIYIGEAGSGKTELALNTTFMFLEKYNKEIVLIDLDQTKSIFRLREKANIISKFSRVEMKWGKQLLDIPITPSGIKEAIKDNEKICIIDVGGNAVGAVQLGQFSKELMESETEIYYCINPYRPFTKANELKNRIEKIKALSSLDEVKFICNPNLGTVTTKTDILEGIQEMEKTLFDIGLAINKVAVSEQVYDELKSKISYETIKLKCYIYM